MQCENDCENAVTQKRDTKEYRRLDAETTLKVRSSDERMLR
jgi:hypothetical protein